MEFNDEALRTVSQEVNWNTVPMIWEQQVDWGGSPKVLESAFIGGYSELKKHLELEEHKEEDDKEPEDDRV